MKTAFARVVAIEFFCPYCDEPQFVSENNTSLISRDTKIHPGQVIECFACGCKFKAPALLKKLA